MTVPRGRIPDVDFWTGRRVLVTGHTGFKGSWLILWLTMLGARIQGLSLPGAGPREQHWDSLDLTIEDDVRLDVVTTDWQARATDFNPEVIIHLAAQSLVSEGYAAPFDTFSTNVMGTARVLDFAAQSPEVAAVLVATTDKVYDARQRLPHSESAFLGGTDPYSASKAAAELVVGAWPRTGTNVVAARAGNVIGGGDWSPQRLIPDLVRAWREGHPVALRRPDAVRPWQHVLEPLAGYLVYLQAASTDRRNLPPALNFGPLDQQRVSVQQVVTAASKVWADLEGRDDAPGFSMESNGEPMSETGELVIDSSLAERALGWHGRLDWQEALHLTLEWYAEAAAGTPVAELSAAQIEQYVAGLRS